MLWLIIEFKELKAIHNTEFIFDWINELWLIIEFKELKAIHNAPQLPNSPNFAVINHRI